MTNRKTTGALVSSVIALVLCCAMLVGSTFAWFTDSASTGVNQIVSGTLDVALEMKDANGEWVSAEGQSLKFTENYWEPGCTYVLPELRIINKGNLALQYTVVINGITDGSDAKLLEAIEFSVDGVNIHDWAGKLEKKDDAVTFALTAHMKEEAGNEYQGLTLTGLGISVYATQVPHETDSFGPNYDDMTITAVDTAAEFAAAVANGGVVVLNDDLTINDQPIAVPAGETLVIDLNGNTLTGVSTSSTTSNLIKVDAGATLVLENGTVSFAATTPDTNWGGVGQPAFPGYANNTISCSGKLIIDGATVENKTAKGGASYAIDCYPGADVVINDGVVNGYDKVAIRTFANSGTTPISVTVNGGYVQGTRAVWVQLPSSNANVTPVVNLTVNGGTLVSTDPAGYYLAIYSYSYGNNADGVNIALNGGSIFGHVAVGGGTKNGRETVTVDPACKLYGDVYRYLANDATEDIADSNAKGGVATDNASLNANLQNNATIFVTDGEFSMSSLSGKEGITIIGSEGTVIGGENTSTGFGSNFGKNTTIKNVTFSGSTNGVRYSYAQGGTTVFENCTFAGDSTYGFHIDESYGATFIFNNCTFSGFNAFASDLIKVEFNNCTFLHNGNYGHTNIWSVGEFNNCTWGEGATFGTRGSGVIYIDGVQQ